MNRLGFFVVSQSDMISGQAQHGINPQHTGTQQIGLQRHTVTISTRHLQDGHTAHLLDDMAAYQRRQPHHRTLVICHIQRVNFIFQQRNMRFHF